MIATPKQKEILECIRRENPRITICHGAKRSGKTFVLTFAFLGHIRKFKNQAFILGGASLEAIRRNVLDDIEKLLGHPLESCGRNCFNIFGNKLYCFEGSNSGSWKRVRGFTSAGAFLNEATALDNAFIKEAISRCSYKDARIFMDTNPGSPSHFVKTDYIDKNGQALSDGQINIRAFHFSVFDNTALDPAYVDSIVKATPTGMFYDRDILGRWVSADGIVYPDFCDELYVDQEEILSMSFTEYYAGVDWGYEHYGSLVVLGDTADGSTVLIEETAKRHMEIEFWVETALDIKSRYGDIPFYCDSARPEHIKRFRREGLRAKNADKSILSGIEQTARRFRSKKLLINSASKRFREEINLYVWDENTGLPKKQYDDVLDSLRYAVYSHSCGGYSGKVLDREELF